MKIGILTFHCAENYGAVLQCYATQEFLKSQGHEVCVIDYRPNYLLRPYQLIHTKRIKCSKPLEAVVNLSKELIHIPKRCYLKWAYRRFSTTYLALTKRVTATSIPAELEAYVVGSDQIWNPKLTKGFDEVYFCRFPFPKERKKYIAYAASMEAKALDAAAEHYYREALQQFDVLSVREQPLQQLLQPLTSQPVCQVLDPTLMVPTTMWDNLSAKVRLPEKYVLVYQGRSSHHTLRIAKEIARQIDAEVVVLGTWFSLEHKLCYRCVSPEGFVHAVRHAACVVTTSFHGTAFSIIFNRPFYTIRLNDGADSRSRSLLTSLGLYDRMVDTASSPTFVPVDYALANTKLDEWRKISQEFLIRVVRG